MYFFITLGRDDKLGERMDPIDFVGQKSKFNVTMAIYGKKAFNHTIHHQFMTLSLTLTSYRIRLFSLIWQHQLLTLSLIYFLNFTLLNIGFHRTSVTGVTCWQGTLTPPDTWFRPFGTCICSTCWDQLSFSELSVILPDYALRISLGTFSICLLTW